MSAAQAAIWTAQQLDPTSPGYNTAEYVEFHGPLDPALFERALRLTVAEAESLHARFLIADGELRQLVEPDAEWPMKLIDLSGHADPRAAAQEWMRADLATPVDLARGPLFAQALVRIGAERYLWYQRVHHIALDGFGYSLLDQRVAAVYSALVSGSPIPPRRFGPLRGVVDNDLEYRSSARFARDGAFWRQRVAGRARPVSLTDAPAGTPARALLRQSTVLPESTVDAWRSAARQLGGDWWQLVVAGTAAYLHQVTGATEVVLGLPTMNRMGTASLRVPTVVMNVVPLRVGVRPGMSLADLVGQVRREFAETEPHHRYRHEQLRRDLRLVGGGRRLFGPAVNVMPLNFDLRFAGHRGTVHNLSAGPVEDLTIHVFHRQDGAGLRIDFDANPALYQAAALAGHQRDWLALLDRATAAPGEPIVAPAPARPPLAVLYGPPLSRPVRPVPEMIADQARRRPDAVAVEDGDRRVTYRELVRRGHRLAGQLAGRGVRPGQLVGVLLPRGADGVVSYLGALAAGGGYLPLDLTASPERLRAVLDDARPVLVVTTAAHADRVAGEEVYLLDGEDDGTPGVPVAATDQDVAFVIYTSGSTGRPKGVMVGRRALARFAVAAADRFGLGPADRVLQFGVPHFDASVGEMAMTLCAGGTLVVRTEDMLASVPAFLATCGARRLTVLGLLNTAFWNELAYAVSTGAARLPDTVRAVIFGGEAALGERVARWRRAVGGGVRLVNGYGPTETCVAVTAADLDRETGEEVPIGSPLPGVQAVVLDSAASDDPAVGELCVVGDQVGLGYLGRPELTAERFTVLAQLPDRPRAYRTGDLVRVRADGQLVFAGRIDDEIKISGHRVDPAEVEAVLLGHPAVREAAVVGQRLAAGSRRLVAHVVAGTPESPLAELREHLRRALPAGVVPAIVLTDRLPRTSTGKIDRAALRAVEPAVADSGGGLADTVRRVLAEVLGVPDLSADDDFFDRGGESLQMLQATNRLGVELGRDVPVALVFQHPTAAALAAALAREPVDAAAGLPAQALADAGFDAGPARSRAYVAGGPVLLTGATGFVGASLLAELLRRTDARVVCPVLARDPDQAAARVRQALTERRLPVADLSRVTALPADLSRPSFGLAADTLADLVTGCRAIYHDAAVVSVAREYASLRAVNVEATRLLLRLAGRAAVPVHHISTLGVAPPGVEVAEDFLPPHPGLRLGYQQTKWVAERLVAQAGAHGLPVAVYRLSRVAGAADTGVVNDDDLFWRIMLPSIRAGAVPALDLADIWTPVDWVARAVVHLSRAGARGPVFNLAPGSGTALADVAAWTREYGYPLARLPLPRWLDLVRQPPGAADPTTLALFSLRAGDEQSAILDLGPVRWENVRHGLAGGEFAAPVVDRALLHRYLDHCVRAGLLPAPAGVGAAA